MNYFIGIDVGTSGAKAILMEQNGAVKHTASSEYPMYTPRPLWSEQNPEEWWSGVQDAVKKLLHTSGVKADDIKGIGLTGQMHGLVTLDKDGKVLYPCIMWNDQRTGKECEEITSKIGFDRLLEITGNPVLPGFTAPKLIWLKKNKPEIFERIDKILLPKDYIRFRLTNQYCCDVSDASGTSLLNVRERNWSKEILSALEIPYEWLPLLAESPGVCGAITAEAAMLTGLKEGTPVVAGGGDQAAGAVGAGAVREGIISLVLGTSGVVFTHSDKYRIEPEGRLHAFCHSVPGAWHLMGVTLSAAGSFQWYKNTFAAEEKRAAAETGKDVYDILTGRAAAIPAGSEGLIYLPYLSGERTPYPDPDAKGTFTGATLRHTKEHFTRAVLEGVAYSLRDCYELIKNLGVTADSVIISGGGAKSPLWRGIIADVLGLEISTLTCTEGAPYGAAILASVGAGYYGGVAEACKAVLKKDTVTFPKKENVNIYNDFYPVYRDLYGALKTTFNNISKAVEKNYGG